MLKDYPLEELKLIYNLLYAQLPVHQKLLNAKLLQDIQDYLVVQAAAEGVDVTQHVQWASWLAK